ARDTKIIRSSPITPSRSTIFRSRAVRSKIIQWSFHHDISVWEFAGTRRPVSNAHVMSPLPLSQIAQSAGGSLSSVDGTGVIDKMSTDSRTIKPGELFVALRGENFDGHNFVEGVAATGAAGAIVDSSWKGKVPENFALIRAKDTLQAYQQLAANYRRSL